MNISLLQTLINNVRDIIFVVLIIQHAGLHFKANKHKILGFIILSFFFTISSVDLFSPLLSALFRTCYRGIIIFLYLYIVHKMDILITFYFSAFINVIIIICHNILFTPLTRPLILCTAHLIDHPTFNAFLCIFIYTLITCIMFYLVYRLLIIDVSSKPTTLQIFSLIILISIATYLNGQMKMLSLNEQFTIEYSVFCIMLQVALLSCLIFYENLCHNIRQQRLSQAELMKTQLLLNSIEQKKEIEESLKTFRHDFKNHLSTIRYQIQNNKVDEAILYINELVGSKVIQNDKLKTGSLLLDALIDDKYYLIEQYSIHIQAKGDFSIYEYMQPIDVCTIFANIIDNAIESCIKINDIRFIDFTSTQAGGYIVSTITNPYDGSYNVDNDLPLTTKIDSVNHGIGLKQVKKCISKYHGYLHIKTDLNKKLFTIIISIPITSLIKKSR